MQFFLYILFYKKKNLTQFYSTELNYPSLNRNKKKIIIKILQRYSILLQKLIINFNVFMNGLAYLNCKYMLENH